MINQTTSPTSALSAKNLTDNFTAALKCLELQLQCLSNDLVLGDAPAFEGHCAQLPQMIEQFAAHYRSLPPHVASHRAVQSRVRVVKNALRMQRENLARRASLVDRELNLLLPSEGGATYGRSRTGYGAGIRTAGSFTSMRA